MSDEVSADEHIIVASFSIQLAALGVFTTATGCFFVRYRRDHSFTQVAVRL